MVLKLVRAAEPFLKAITHRILSPWKGNHVIHVSMRNPSPSLLPLTHSHGKPSRVSMAG